MTTESLPTAGETDDGQTRTAEQTSTVDDGVITGEVVDITEARAARHGEPDHDDEDEDEEGHPRLVDLPANQQAAGLRWSARRLAEANRAPVLPGWLRSLDEARSAGRWALRLVLHTAAYHLVRVPKYAVRLVIRSPIGAGRLMRQLVRWVWDAENEPLRQHCASKGDTDTYLKLVRERDRHVRWRGMVTTAVTPLAALALVLAVWLTPFWPGIVAAVAAVMVLGVAGRPADKPIIDRAVTLPQVPKLSSDVVIRALGSLGIAEINKALAKDGVGVTFPAPIVRDGPGFRAEVDLPYGVTVTDIMDRRDRVASGLRRSLGCVWPEPSPDEHAGRLVLWVGDQDLAKAKVPAWPLARAGKADLFHEIPFGVDQRLRKVGMLLMYNSVLIGAMPRQGKTVTMLILLLACALDPRVELRIFELKGTGDLQSLEQVAYHYGSSAKDEVLAACVESLREVKAELDRRAEVINKLPRHLCPEFRVTSDLASKKSLGLHPIVFDVDEAQELFTHPVYGSLAAELCAPIIKRGPALGIILILATQIPDKESIPKSIQRNIGIRFCLRVMDHTANDMVLGTGMHKGGVRANDLRPRDKGIGWLVGVGDEPMIIRTNMVNGVEADKIAKRARAVREAEGRLTGQAAGETTAASTETDLLDDIAAACAGLTGKVWSETVIEHLTQHRPGVYSDWTPAQLATVLEPFGIDTDQIARRLDGKTVNRRGIDLADITQALQHRQQRKDTAA